MTAVLDIACSTDERYAPHCATMLQSLLAQHPAATLRIHILHGTALAPETRARLQGFVERAGARVNCLAVPDALIAGFPDRRFHVSCWYRVLLPRLLPDIDRVLYLDADMLVLAPLHELWQTDLDGRLFAAVVNPLYPFMPDRGAALGLAGADEYLNSGVMLMDLARMRAEALPERLREYGAAHPDHPWPEQDALSAVCRHRWLHLPPRWNVQTTLFDLPRAQLPFAPADIEAALENPAILHFIGPLKPWSYLCRHPLRHLYAVHRRGTPWPQFELEGRTFKNMLLRPFSLGMQVRLRAWARAARRRGAAAGVIS